MKLECGYAHDETETTPPGLTKRQHVDLNIDASGLKNLGLPASLLSGGAGGSIAAAAAGLLGAGNLNNINLSHLVNNLLSLQGLNLQNLAQLSNSSSLSSLAALAQLPIDFSALGAMNLGFGNVGADRESNVETSSEVRSQASQIFNQQLVDEPQQAPSYQQGENARLLRLLLESALEEEPVTSDAPSILPNIPSPSLGPSNFPAQGSLNMLDLRLMFHYTTQVASTITGAGISDTDIWNHDVPMLAFEYRFLMHAVLAFSATHLARTETGLDQCVTWHRGEALKLLREEILDINADNTDALVASALVLIMDSLANALVPLLTSPKLLPASAWIFHVKGAATILTAVWPLTEISRFYKFISVDLGDLGDIIAGKSQLSSTKQNMFADLDCHDSDIADLYPVPLDSKYLVTMAYLNKLHKERYKADFILRIFAFPALLDKDFIGLLMTGDVKAMRIMRSYYKLLRSFTTEMKDKVWFLEGVSTVLPVDVEEYAGGAGGMHMMLDFLGGGPAIVEDHEIDKDLSLLDPGGRLANKLIDTENLPSDITSDLEVMQGDGSFIG